MSQCSRCRPGNLAGERADTHLVTALGMYREMEMRFWLEKAAAAAGELA